MKLRNILYGLAIIVLLTTRVNALNTIPVVTNVTFSIAGTMVTVHYDVTDAEQNTVTIIMEVSSDNGVTWDFAYGPASGDIGTGIAIGNTKTITWTYNGVYNNQSKVRIIANDLVIDGGSCADPTITYSGKTYNTVQIGTQCWLKENLDVGVYVASTDIGGSYHSDVSDNGIIEKYCYENNEANCATYGGLYDWNEAMQYVTTPGTKGICPTGWHIPTVVEFQTLTAAVGDDGNALKAVGQGDLNTGTNTSGFSALLAGLRDASGPLYGLADGTYFGSSIEGDALGAYYLGIENDFSSLDLVGYGYKENGYSIRCLKN